jgi:large subunit ribosomal protein L6
MSRIGKKPIVIPEGVSLDINEGEISVKGPKGLLAMQIMDEVTFDLNEKQVVVTPRDNSKKSRSMWGMQRTMVSNLIEGVTAGFEKKLLINGVGYRAQMKGSSLNLQLGYSHDINFVIPDGVAVECPDQTTIIIKGIDKQKVGQAAAKIREFRKPEPYKGKGIKYDGEYIFRKEGKKK